MFYEKGDVTVDDHFARFGSKSYAVGKIRSVDVRIERKRGCAWISLSLIAMVSAAGALGTSASAGVGEASTEWLTFLIVAMIAVVLFRTRPQPKYDLMLATSSGELEAYSSSDRNLIEELRAAVDRAITRRVG